MMKSKDSIIIVLLMICAYLVKNNRDLRSVVSDIERDNIYIDQHHRALKGKHERLPWSDDDRKKAIKSMMDFPSLSSLQDMDKRICDSNITCLEMAGKHNVPANAGGCTYRESQKSVLVNGKILS